LFKVKEDEDFDRRNTLAVFRGSKSESDVKIAENSHLWMGTSYMVHISRPDKSIKRSIYLFIYFFCCELRTKKGVVLLTTPSFNSASPKFLSLFSNTPFNLDVLQDSPLGFQWLLRLTSRQHL